MCSRGVCGSLLSIGRGVDHSDHCVWCTVVVSAAILLVRVLRCTDAMSGVDVFTSGTVSCHSREEWMKVFGVVSRWRD